MNDYIRMQQLRKYSIQNFCFQMYAHKIEFLIKHKVRYQNKYNLYVLFREHFTNI